MTIARRVSTALLSALLVVAALPAAPIAAADAEPAIVTFSAVENAIEHAQTVTASAYTLASRSVMARLLTRASERGARVGLVLTGDGMPYAVSANRNFVSGHPGMHVVLTSRGPLHLKAIVIDHGAGGVFVSDRNWTPKHSLVLRLPARYALTVERAALEDPHDAGDFTATKGSSLAREADIIAHARRSVAMETESFSDRNPVYDAILAARGRGVNVTLLVAQREYGETPRERDLIADLMRSGVHCGLSANSQKLLVIDDGAAAWIGSSNATSGIPNQVDFGFASNDARLIAAIRSELARDTRANEGA